MKKDYEKRVSNPFWLCAAPFKNINACYSLKELRNALKKAPVSVIKHHVAKDKNDFADWIRNIIGSKALANKVRKLKAKNRKELKNKLIKELK